MYSKCLAKYGRGKHLLANPSPSSSKWENLGFAGNYYTLEEFRANNLTIDMADKKKVCSQLSNFVEKTKGQKTS